MTPEQAVQDIIRSLREAADRLDRGEDVALIFATNSGGPTGAGSIFLFAPPLVAGDLTLRILGAGLNLCNQTQNEIAGGKLVMVSKSAN